MRYNRARAREGTDYNFAPTGGNPGKGIGKPEQPKYELTEAKNQTFIEFLCTFVFGIMNERDESDKRGTGK